MRTVSVVILESRNLRLVYLWLWLIDAEPLSGCSKDFLGLIGVRWVSVRMRLSLLASEPKGPFLVDVDPLGVDDCSFYF